MASKGGISCTFELVQAHAPHAGLAENLSRTFGIDPVDYAAVLEATEGNIGLSAKALQPTLNDKASDAGETKTGG